MISHPDINSLSSWQLLPIPARLRRSGPKAAGSRSIQEQLYYNIFPFLCKPRWYIVRIMHRWWGHNKVTMRDAWQMIRERMGKMQAVQEIINVFVASVVSLAVLFILTRLGGKRQIAQMNLFDYVNSITIGSIAAEMATNLEQWYRPLTAMIVYGIAFDFFNISGSLFIEQETSSSIRASAQGLFFMMTNGLGAIIGGYASGAVVDAFSVYADGKLVSREWPDIWFIFAAYALVIGILFALVFKYKHQRENKVN